MDAVFGVLSPISEYDGVMEVVDVKGLELLSLAGVLGCSGDRPLLASNSSYFRLFLSSIGSGFCLPLALYW